MEVEHFCHPHPLTLNTAEQLSVNGEQVICFGCEEPIKGPPSYTCKSCDDEIFLHKKCFELPSEIKSVLHPQHPLCLLAEPPSNYEGSVSCNSCKKVCKKFFYHCSLCNFVLDIQCAFPPCINYEGEGQQEHQFRCLLNSLSFKTMPFTCSACGTDGDASPFMCIMCQLTVHEECISLPRTIKTLLHRHRQLIHTYHLQRCDESTKQCCGICRLEVDTKYGGYCCPDCDFVAHVKCGIRTVKSAAESGEEITEEDEEEGEQSITRNDAVFRIVREIKQGEEKMIMEIEHFSHQHNLILIDKNFDDDCLKCDGCMLLMSTPFYGCIECNFFLHKTCVELPRRRKVKYHKHSLTLISTAWENDGFDCSCCGQYCYGFRYICDKRCDDVCFDIRCMGLFGESLHHEGHDHPLFLAIESKKYDCSSCGDEGDGEYGLFRCTACDNFNLDIECATLPYKARHKYDEHPLLLTYVDPKFTYQLVCQICEGYRLPFVWFYRCEECDFDAHTVCALGKYPFVKLGNPRIYGFHHHPLALVEKAEDDDYPACRTCGKPCDDLALKCTEFKCDFIIHGKGGDCMPPL